MATHHQKYVQVSKVGIIGAGISGIAATKQLRDYEPLVFEATDSIGGVWRHCSYSSTKLQTPRLEFQFSDFPWKEGDNSKPPSHHEILDYLESYASHFDILKFIKFNSKVVEIRYIGEEKNDMDSHIALPKNTIYGPLLRGYPAWEVAVEINSYPEIQWYAFEFLVVCLGKYGDVPRLPVHPPARGPEVFKGKVMHSIDYAKLDKHEAREVLKGKKVVIVGYRKSALDLALEAAEANQGQDGQPCTMIVRTLHWTVPSPTIWGLPFFVFYYARFTEFLQPRPNQSSLRSALCTLFSPLRKGISAFVESYLLWKQPLEKYGLKPESSFEEDIASCLMAFVSMKFFEAADEGLIKFKRPSNWWFCNDGLEFDDGSKVEADVVILATGYDGSKKLKALFPHPFSNILEDSEGIMPLYRGVIHPLIPNMAFIGYIEHYSNLHSSEIRSKWLSRLADRQFELPSIEKMIEQVQSEVKVMKKVTRFYKRRCISTMSFYHSDEICKDMGWKAWRKTNRFSEIFGSYTSRDY